MATTTVSYNGKKIQPAPFVEIVKNFNRSANGDITGTTFTIVVNGKLMSYKGSPTSSGTFNTGSNYLPDETVSADSRLTSILRKQDALRNLFSTDGYSFEIQGADGAQPLKCNPRIVGPIQFNQGTWFETCDYNVTLEADVLYPQQENSGLNLITDAQESWQIETQEEPEALGMPRTYRLTHNVSAVGKKFYDGTGTLTQEAWQNARDFVLPLLGFNSTYVNSSGVKDLPSYYSGYNHVRNESIDKRAGGYSITETWLLASGTALEDFTVETIRSIDTGLVNVGIQGNIIGLEQRDANMQLTTTKYANALTKFDIASGLALSRAQTYSGYTLNILPLEQKVAKNPVTGNINYSYSFDNRPSNIITGSLSESISIVDNFDEQVVAIIPILGRAAGPILQDIGTKKEMSRQLSIDVVMPITPFGTGLTITDLRTAFFGNRPTVQVSGIINAANPSGQGFTAYQVSNNETWNPKNGHYSRQIGWIYQ